MTEAPEKQETIQDHVARLLKETRTFAPPIDVFLIARHLGIDIREQPDAGDISGCLVQAPNKRPVIGLNATHHPNRKRFTVAHEIGHYVLKHKDRLYVDRAQNFRVSFRDTESSQARLPEEIAANRFAAELLMPTPFLHKDLDALGGIDLGGSGSNDVQTPGIIESLAQRYGVSQQALTYRLIGLGVLPS